RLLLAQMRDPVNVDDSEKRLHQHFEHHRNRQQKDRAANAAISKILLRPAHGFSHGRPEARGLVLFGRDRRRGRFTRFLHTPSILQISRREKPAVISFSKFHFWRGVVPVRDSYSSTPSA